MISTTKTVIYSFIITGIGILSKIFIKDDSLGFLLLVIAIVVALLIIASRFLKKDSDYQKNLLIAAGFAVTIIGWFASSYFNNKNELQKSELAIRTQIENQKRDLKIRYLIDAYFRISNMASRDSETVFNQHVFRRASEQAITTVQLFGDSILVRAVNDFVRLDLTKKTGIYGDNDTLPVNDLLGALRDGLRAELGLSELSTAQKASIVFQRWWLKSSFRKEHPELTEKEIELTIKSMDYNLPK